MSEEIKPALTPEEWANGYELPDPYSHVRVLEDERIGGLMVTVETPADISFEGAERHAVAALCLNGQPFGFTWADVDLLRQAAGMAAEEAGAFFLPEMQERVDARMPFDNLADRIASLLPPREP